MIFDERLFVCVWLHGCIKGSRNTHDAKEKLKDIWSWFQPWPFLHSEFSPAPWWGRSGRQRSDHTESEDGRLPEGCFLHLGQLRMEKTPQTPDTKRNQFSCDTSVYCICIIVWFWIDICPHTDLVTEAFLSCEVSTVGDHRLTGKDGVSHHPNTWGDLWRYLQLKGNLAFSHWNRKASYKVLTTKIPFFHQSSWEMSTLCQTKVINWRHWWRPRK